MENKERLSALPKQSDRKSKGFLKEALEEVSQMQIPSKATKIITLNVDVGCGPCGHPHIISQAIEVDGDYDDHKTGDTISYFEFLDSNDDGTFRDPDPD